MIPDLTSSRLESASRERVHKVGDVSVTTLGIQLLRKCMCNVGICEIGLLADKHNIRWEDPLVASGVWIAYTFSQTSYRLFYESALTEHARKCKYTVSQKKCTNFDTV